MLDDLDGGVKVILIVVVALALLFVAVPLILFVVVPILIILVSIIASFVLGLGEEAALVLPMCGPAVARRLRRSCPW